MQLRYIENELENVGWERRKLEKHLQTAVKEHRMMELIFADLEDQLDKAIAKIQILQDEVVKLTFHDSSSFWFFVSQQLFLIYFLYIQYCLVVNFRLDPSLIITFLWILLNIY